MKKTLILAFALTIIATFTGMQSMAQTKEEAGNAFNAALELSKTDMAGAIVKMQDVLTMCSKVGPEADSLKMKVTKVLPAWQYNVGNSILKDKKYDQALAAFEKSSEFATAYGDENIREKSNEMLEKLYTNKGNTLLKDEKADSAIFFLDKALKLDPEYSKALFAKGQAFKKKGDNAKMIENMELAIASASKTNDTVTMKAARSAIGNTLYTDGKTAFTKKAYAEAAEKLNSALAYDYKNKECYYLLASSNNFIKKYDEAIEAANLGLALEEQTPVKMARFYYELAKAYEGKNDNSNACANYKKSAVGTFKASADYQMKTVLKCQ
jgi:tetratricopeptide (TPR) repeat protein